MADPAQTFGPYTLRRRIGAGGMAAVFEAERRDRPGALVALKRVLDEHLGNATFEQMFRDEISIAQRIEHPNVLRVIDACAEPPAQYLALELVDGVDASRLQRAVERGDAVLSSSAIAWLGAAVARGLHAAHEARDDEGRPLCVVHRDVSPANVFVTRDGAVKLGDFGVAFANDRVTRTITGAVKGKVSFMAPEQLAGLAVDRRSDVFSLACTLHALAVGRSPVVSIDQLAAILRDGQLALSDAVPDTLRQALSKALAPAPSARFESALAFAEALDELVIDGEEARADLARLSASLADSPEPRPLFDALWSLDAPPLSDDAEPSRIPTAAAAIAPRVERGAPPIRLRSRARPRALIAVVALLSAGALAVVLARLRSASPTELVRAPIAADASIEDGTIRAATPAQIDAAVLERADVVDVARAERRVSTRSSLAVRDAGAAPSLSDSVVMAWLRVGFAQSPVQGARLVVDGVERGWAPARVSVAVGRRHVVVRDPQGNSLLDQWVQIGPEHTSLSPRVLLAGP